MGDRRRRRSTGAVEGQHGPKTHRQLLAQLAGGPAPGTEEREGKLRAGMTERHPKREGRARLVENREQHDEADKNSEQNRLQKDINRERRIPGADAPANYPQSPKS